MVKSDKKLGQETSQKDLILEFFHKHPRRNIPHPEIVDWVTNEFKSRTGRVFRDPDRAVRKLHQEGFLIKVKKGVYKYDPDLVKKRDLEEFTPTLKEKIFERDNYRCVICGRGKAEGFEIHADHIRAKDLGGRATLENGQTLCSQHNFIKKNTNQTETGKKMFVRLYELAKSENDKELIRFTTDILEVFEKSGRNGHIEWNK